MTWQIISNKEIASTNQTARAIESIRDDLKALKDEVKRTIEIGHIERGIVLEIFQDLETNIKFLADTTEGVNDV